MTTTLARRRIHRAPETLAGVETVGLGSVVVVPIVVSVLSMVVAGLIVRWITGGR